MKNVIKNYLMCALLLCTATTHARIPLPRTVVSLLNTIEPGKPGHRLPVTFKGVSNIMMPLGIDYFWPEPGHTFIASGPTQEDKSGVTTIAECPRYRGLENGVQYTFVEVVELPNLGPVLELTQRITGTWNGSTASVGVAAPSLGIAQQWFDDTKWHQITIPNNDARRVHIGNFIVSFCFYHRPSVLMEESGSVAQKMVQAFNAAGATLLGLGCGGLVAMEKEEEEEEEVEEWPDKIARMKNELARIKAIKIEDKDQLSDAIAYEVYVKTALPSLSLSSGNWAQMSDLHVEIDAYLRTRINEIGLDENEFKKIESKANQIAKTKYVQMFGQLPEFTIDIPPSESGKTEISTDQPPETPKSRTTRIKEHVGRHKIAYGLGAAAAVTVAISAAAYAALRAGYIPSPYANILYIVNYQEIAPELIKKPVVYHENY